MAQINNDSITRKLLEVIRGSVSDGVPNQVSNVISPVLEVSPEPSVTSKENARATTGTTTVHTASTINRTFITGIQLSNQSDANADNTLIEMKSKNAKGEAISLARMSKITLTAFQDTIVHDFTEPIEVEKGATITIGSTFSVGASNTAGVVFFYEVEEN